MGQMYFVVLLPNRMVVEPKVASGFQQQIDELEATNRETAPSREKILKRIHTELRLANQRLRDLTEEIRLNVAEWYQESVTKVEALIELLEVHDCGSVGGFDPEVGSDQGLRYLEERFEVLKRKYAPDKTKKKKSRGA